MDSNKENKPKKETKKLKLDSKYVQLIVASVLCLALGFFSGRYYERKARSKAMSAMREQMETSTDGEKTERPEGMMPGMGRGGGMIPR